MRATTAEMGGPTWFGSEGQSSLIDYVWAPAALPLRCSGPLRRLAAELQLISTRQLRDHVPLGLEFDYVQLAGQPASGEREAWNADALMEGVRVGTKRSEFLAALEDRVGAEEARWTPLLELHYPDLLDDYLNKILVETGQRFFKKEPMDAPGYSDLAAKREGATCAVARGQEEHWRRSPSGAGGCGECGGAPAESSHRRGTAGQHLSDP